LHQKSPGGGRGFFCVFAGLFNGRSWENACFLDGFSWLICGRCVVSHGVLKAILLQVKNTPVFLNYFLYIFFRALIVAYTQCIVLCKVTYAL
jgi:hypothetical protein